MNKVKNFLKEHWVVPVVTLMGILFIHITTESFGDRITETYQTNSGLGSFALSSFVFSLKAIVIGFLFFEALFLIETYIFKKPRKMTFKEDLSWSLIIPSVISLFVMMFSLMFFDIHINQMAQMNGDVTGIYVTNRNQVYQKVVVSPYKETDLGEGLKIVEQEKISFNFIGKINCDKSLKACNDFVSKNKDKVVSSLSEGTQIVLNQ